MSIALHHTSTDADQTRSAWAEYIDFARSESLENRRCARRVRYEARDALGVVAFSAGASTLLSLLVAVALSWAA